MAESHGQVFFGVDARHLQQLGQELVGDRITALAELVKNAYDADATSVTVSFDLTSNRPELRIEDDGHGLSLADLERTWMRLSTPEKDRAPVSPLFKRARSGKKGIGRFATESLGAKLELSSTTAGSNERLIVEFDWSQFVSGAELSTVGSAYRKESAAIDEHGTRLVIHELHHRWTENDLIQANRALLLIQPPFPVARVAGSTTSDPGFEALLIADGNALNVATTGYDEFIDSATAQIHLVVDSHKTRVTVRSEVFDFDESFELDHAASIGPCEARLAYFVYRTDALGSIKVRLAQAMSRQFGGIRLYRDGLRIMPYGDPGVDWLGLDEIQGSRSSTLVPVRNVNWFGQVLIGRDANPGLIDTASREGLVQNSDYFELRRVLVEALVRAAERIAERRGRKSRTTSKPEPTSRSETATEAATAATAAVTEALPADDAARVSQAIAAALAPTIAQAESADAAEAARVESLTGEIELLRVLASLGTSIAVFNHEVQSVLDNATAAFRNLTTALTNASVPDDATLATRRAGQSLDRLHDLSAYISSYVSVSQRRQREPQALFTVVEDFVDGLSGTLARGADISWSVDPDSLRTDPMTRSELDTVLINFLTNAVKAMNREGIERREIKIDATARDGSVVLRFQDTGIGVEPAYAERIFEPFVSDTRSSVSALGIGTGLGLKIVRDIAEAYGGTAALGEPDVGYATCFQFEVPRWQRQRQS